jgi:hypothetical protein
MIDYNAGNVRCEGDASRIICIRMVAKHSFDCYYDRSKFWKEAMPSLLGQQNVPGTRVYASLSSRIFDNLVSSSTQIYKLRNS